MLLFHERSPVGIVIDYLHSISAAVIYSQHRLISRRLIEHSRKITAFLGPGRPH